MFFKQFQYMTETVLIPKRAFRGQIYAQHCGPARLHFLNISDRLFPAAFKIILRQSDLKTAQWIQTQQCDLNHFMI